MDGMNQAQALPRQVTVLASANAGKLAELSSLLVRAGIELRSMTAFGLESPEEDGEMFIENALIKARHASSATGLPAIADDSGIGAGAHGKLTLPTGIVRTNKAKQPGRYLEDQSPEDTPVEAKDLPLEYMMNALRLVRGTDEAAYPERTGLPIETISGEIARLRGEGLMRQDRIGLTDFGFSHLDTVVARFF